VQLANATAKLHALECYKTEIKNFPHPCSPEYLESLMNIRGSAINSKFAEGFMLIKGSV